MTQGEILSALAPLDTMISICDVNRERQYLTGNDVNMIMPFVTEAKKAAEKLSRFALEHFNSNDRQKRALSKKICERLKVMRVDLSGVGFNALAHDTTPVDWLENNIKSVTDLLSNTVEAVDSLSGDTADESAKQDARIKELEAKIKELEAQMPTPIPIEEIEALFNEGEEIPTGGKAENKDLAEAQKLIAELQAENAKLRAENESLRKQLEECQKHPQTIEMQKKNDDWIVELLAHLCYEDEQVARSILENVRGKEDFVIVDIIYERKQQKQISQKTQNREIWRILHAAKLYQSTEGNFNTALRRRQQR